MKLIVSICFVLLTTVNCQFVFPDEFEQANSFTYGTTPPRLPPFPTLNSANANFRPINSNAGGRGGAHSAIPQTITMTNQEKYWTNHVNNILARGVTQFALHMDHAIDINQQATAVGLDRDNVVFSPINLVGTLAVVLLGAAGRTFNEIVNILGFEAGIDISGHSEIVHQMFGFLLNSVESHGKSSSSSDGVSRGSEVFFAGGVFLQNGYSIRPEFLSIAQGVYKNDVINVDFLRQPKSAQSVINNWVNAKTRGKIRNILNDIPNENTKVILASALYFNGEWNQHFMKGATKRKQFYLASGQTITVDMMYNGGYFPFYEDKQLGVEILGLPYKNGEGDAINMASDGTFHFEATMYVLLPTQRNKNALNNLESRLSPEIIESLISKMINTTCIIGMPRMKLSSTLSLNRALQSLGLTSLFIPGAANLGLLSSGTDTSTSIKDDDDDPFIFSRINDGGEEARTTAAASDYTGKKNYIRYEDKNGGYSVQQWNNGVYFEKIHRVVREEAKRNSEYSIDTDGTQTTDNIDRVKVVGLGEDKYHFQESTRHKRQNRPVDADFVKFIESQGFPSYGLDALRNSANLANPGLYASDVIHKVEIDITETGTVAAAATGVVLQRNGDQKRLVANRPFLFFIRHDSSRLILFWGTVNKPTPNYS